MSELGQKTKKLTELEEEILREKEKGTPDIEIGKNYNVTFRFIEKLVTKSQGINVSQINKKKTIKSFAPKNFKLESTSVWSFKSRGNWATHSGEYRGNWSPYIPRNIILRYSQPGDIVLDNFCGAGTTAIECKLLGRQCISIDINDNAIKLAKKNLDFEIEAKQLSLFANNSMEIIYEPQLYVADARNLDFISDNSIDLICSHPPYANIIHYTNSKEGDLSSLNVNEFIQEMNQVAKESLRVLKPGKKCAVLIGDTRINKRIVPLGFKLLEVYLKNGFILKEIIIKRQHNCKTTGFWYANSIKHNFLLLAHEYLFILEKPKLKIQKEVKDNKFQYLPISFEIEKFISKKKLSELQTTSVWIFNEENFEKLLIKNIAERYANNKHLKIIELVTHQKNELIEVFKDKKLNINLLFIKSGNIIKKQINFELNLYLQKIEILVNQYFNNIEDKGFVVIQTMDFRTNEELIPTAKIIIDLLTKYDLLLKEIIIVTKDNYKLEENYSSNEIEIVHQYLLVFEVRHSR